ncbi:MAG: DUF190 domain-containing protein [Nitrospirae bacterium]|nr:DUF190 domain-containing protein [Nitrospirota bacterium]MBF0534515.1 DUF190 domain-containing protein [Nitrospirota bacterium]MBF0617141.1 DUF190 domain-containing protein [Nitrospirota bacterium]
MIIKGPAKKLTIYVDENEKYGDKPVYETVIELFLKKGISGVTLFKGTAGFGRGAVVHSSKILELSENLPLKIEAIDTQEAINTVLPDIYLIVDKGLIEISDTEIVKWEKRAIAAKMPEVKRRRTQYDAKMLQIMINENDKWHGEPMADALLKRFAMEEITGITVFKGITGYGSHKEVHKHRFFSLAEGLPVLLIIVEMEDKIERALQAVDDILTEGIVSVCDVNAIRYSMESA